MISGIYFHNGARNELKKIPKDEVRIYKEIALATGRQNSRRAVANACGKKRNQNEAQVLKKKREYK